MLVLQPAWPAAADPVVTTSVVPVDAPWAPAGLLAAPRPGEALAGESFALPAAPAASAVAPELMDWRAWASPEAPGWSLSGVSVAATAPPAPRTSEPLGGLPDAGGVALVLGGLLVLAGWRRARR